MEPIPHSAYDEMVIAARQALSRGRAQDFTLSPAALELAAEMDINPAVVRTHFLLLVYKETLAGRPRNL
ncbi:hypothetical protein ACLQ2R_17000 [Streptosporangium sp. DT93]|uniref:hypothetical protein n=1 Tax=Streptosporangium sp. DT93 TaxID=3393428 RepID=UPI003CEC3377